MSDLAARLLALPEAERREVLATLTTTELHALEYAWPIWARPDQLPPLADGAAWRTWLLLGGRGSGKTRSSAEWVRASIESGRRRQMGIIGPTADAVRRIQIEGPSGLLFVCPAWNRPTYEPSTRRVTWPSGAVCHLFSAEEPDRLRGPNLDGFWGDELTSWENQAACWDMLQMALRVTGPKGDAPAGVLSTTPKMQPLLKAILKDPSTVTTRSRTSENVANLDASTLRYLNDKYGGTTLGRQELDAELLEDLEGALWNRKLLDACRVGHAPCGMRRVVVGVDPSGGSNKGNAETGIIVAGRGEDGHCYVTGDASGRYTPDGWGRKAVLAYLAAQADRIVCEVNYGGAMVEATIRAVDPNVPVKPVTASRGKAVRAEPVVALYEQRRVHHVGNFQELEDQLCGWDPMETGPSPDRLDALVWCVTELMVEKQPQPMRAVRIDLMGR